MRLECRDICRNRFASERLDASQQINAQSIRSENCITVKGDKVPFPITTFDSLPPQIIENLKVLKCIVPTPVQMQAIPSIMAGKHTVFSASTNQGKSLAYLVPIVAQILDHRSSSADETGPLSLIIAPSRELCIQIESCAKCVMKNIPKMKTALLVGGLPLPSQLYRLECGVEMIIATPARFLEIFEEMENGNWKHLLQNVLSFVVDEVDKMLEASFCDQVVEIMSLLRNERSSCIESLQFVACTATESPFLEQAIDALLHSSSHSGKIWIQADATPTNKDSIHMPACVRPRVIWTKVHEKKHLLFEFLEARPRESTLVFVASRAGTDMLADSITKKCSQIKAQSLHGGKTQSERLAIMEAFTTREIHVLVATLVLARGIHLTLLDNVLVFDLPQNISALWKSAKSLCRFILRMENHSDTQTEEKRDVYSRLSDVRSFTGVQKKRFEPDTHDLSEQNVHNLSETIRSSTTKSSDTKSRRSQKCTSPRSGISSEPSVDSVLKQHAKGENAMCKSPLKEERTDFNDPHTLLKGIFHYYCRFGRTAAKGVDAKTLDNANFSKLCRECPELVDSRLTRTEIDLIFVKVKKKGERRINYARFLDALGMIASEKYPELPLEQSVPKLLGTHLVKLPCIPELTNGKTVQAVWLRRYSVDNSCVEAPPPPSIEDTSTAAQLPSEDANFATQLPPAPSSVSLDE
uniref:RNA helicase n=1 Tax=Albugo laibachii Nc14 TaxID=890382 RepID=F0W921_9STRA|nr:DEAD/DEAH box RNA helicase putative [Albugo laibachii Nc14]|eukprot:CCA17632.1 DEAD/DEAH box RNA helicase putative [Albugo laibachii Nc14]